MFDLPAAIMAVFEQGRHSFHRVFFFVEYIPPVVVESTINVCFVVLVVVSGAAWIAACPT